MHPTGVFILPLRDPTSLDALAAEADAEGHRMVSRMIAEWIAGDNRFELPGERAYAAILNDRICGVCGLNIDPFAGDRAIGRVRRLYVSPSKRRQGAASALIRKLVSDAADHFQILHLRTFDPAASAFYLAAGFAPVEGNEHCTHILSL